MGLPGFSETYEKTNEIAIYCNAQKAASWYYRENDENIVLPPSLTGKITKIEEWTKPAEGKYSEQEKLSVKVSTPEQNYSLVMGRYSAFSKGLISAIVNAERAVFDSPVKIVVRGGESSLLSSVYDASGSWIKGLDDWKSRDWVALSKQAIAKINGASTTVEQQPEPVEETIEYDYTEEPIDRKAVMSQIKAARESIGWGQEQVVGLIGALFDRTSPTQLTDEQLVELLAAIEAHGSTELVPFEQTIATPKVDNYRKRIAAAKTESDCELIQVDLERDRGILSDPICNKLLNDLQQVRRSILALPF